MFEAQRRPDFKTKVLDHHMNLAHRYEAITCQIWDPGARHYGHAFSEVPGDAPVLEVPLLTKNQGTVELDKW